MGAVLDRLTVEMFEEQLGKTFRLLRTDAPPLSLVLIEARKLTLRQRSTGQRREPFALLFLGPTQPILPQRIYPLENEALGRHEIFLVPIGNVPEGVQYEAIFN